MPAEATVRIFNSAGELIKTIEHSPNSNLAPSIAQWDLRNEYNQLVAPGVYFYSIISGIGSKTGKFFVIL
jgi:hypothetical protein